MAKLHVKKGDQVVVISGKDRGVKGAIISAFPKTGRVIVDNVNMVTRHTKPKRMGQAGGRIQHAAPIDASNVMLFCSKCNKGVRVARMVEEGKNGKKITVRSCKKCGSKID